MQTINYGFKVGVKEPIDVRLILTKDEMVSCSGTRPKYLLPTIYLAICSDDGKLYLYNENNEILETTGKYRLYEAPVDSTDLSLKLPNALTEAMSTQEKAQEICDAMFDSEHFQVSLDNKIDLAVSLIQAIDSN